MAKKPISLRIEEKLYLEIKKKPNVTRYIEGLIKEDLQMRNKKNIVSAVREELLQDEAFFREMANRLNVTAPTVETSEDVPECCLNKSVKCKHWEYDEYEYSWVNSNTGEVIET